MPLIDLAALADVDEHLAYTVTSFLRESPTVQRDAPVLNRCGPIAFAFAVYLRANSLPGGLVHVSGQPSGFPAGTGHYMTTSMRWVIDFAYRQFDPEAPLPLIYDQADLDRPRAWHPWDAISGELEADDPLYPDFVEYPLSTDPMTYVVASTADPEWVTPIDER